MRVRAGRRRGHDMLVMFDGTEPGASARPGCRTAAAITPVRWHSAVAFAAGSDTCVRPDLLKLPETAKPHCPLRDPTSLHWAAEKQRVVSPQCLSAGKSRLEENSLTYRDLTRRSLSAEASARPEVVLQESIDRRISCVPQSRCLAGWAFSPRQASSARVQRFAEASRRPPGGA